MQRIEIDTASLQRCIRSVEADIAALEREIEKAYDGIRQLDTMWDGAANAAFNAQFNADYNRMKEICGVLKQYNSNLQQAKKQYEDGENNVADIIAAIRI